MSVQKSDVRASLAALLLAALGCPAVQAAPQIWLKQENIDVLRQQGPAVRKLLAQCEKELDKVANPVAVYAPPLHYTATGSVQTSMSKDFSGDGRMAYRSALCYVASQDLRYARHAQALVGAWSSTIQSVPTPQGVAEMTFNLPFYVLAASMVRDVGNWDDRTLRHWLSDIVLPLPHANTENNHANWNVFLTSAIAGYLGDAQLFQQSRQHWLALMDKQVTDDGTLPLETCRTDTNNYCDGPRKGISGISYTHYTLLPTTAAGWVFEVQGQSVWATAQGQKLASAYRKAAQWTVHPETFPYYAAHQDKLIGVRNAAYFPLLQRYYPNPDGAQAVAQGGLGMDALEWGAMFGPAR